MAKPRGARWTTITRNTEAEIRARRALREEARRVVEQEILGRPIPDGYWIHYIDGNLENVDPSNLQPRSPIGLLKCRRKGCPKHFNIRKGGTNDFCSRECQCIARRSFLVKLTCSFQGCGEVREVRPCDAKKLITKPYMCKKHIWIRKKCTLGLSAS